MDYQGSGLDHAEEILLAAVMPEVRLYGNADQGTEMNILSFEDCDLVIKTQRMNDNHPAVMFMATWTDERGRTILRHASRINSTSVNDLVHELRSFAEWVEERAPVCLEKFNEHG